MKNEHILSWSLGIHYCHVSIWLWNTTLIHLQGLFPLQIKETPWCFRTGVEVHDNVEWVWAAQRSSWPKKMQHIELKAKLQTISGKAVFSLTFIAQREIFVYSLLSCMPVLHSQQTMLWRNEVLQRSAVFLTRHPLQPKKLLSFTSGWLLLS